MTTRRDAIHCSFVLLAEFDILEGAQLKHQFPHEVGVNEGVLAMSMLPDGAETQVDDWTVFFLNQTPFNTVSSAASESGDGAALLYVLNLVRTKHDKTMKRGGIVRALAICTEHPSIHVFKHLLLLAMDDYFTDPSVGCLARLFDAINAMDLSAAPTLTRAERLILRGVERKDVFREKFPDGPFPSPSQQKDRSAFPVRNDSNVRSMPVLSEAEDASNEGSVAASDDNMTDASSHENSTNDTKELMVTPERQSSFPYTSPNHMDSLGRSQPLHYWPLRNVVDSTPSTRPASLSSDSRTNTEEGSFGSDISLVGGDTLVGRALLDDSVETTQSTNIPNLLSKINIPPDDKIPQSDHLQLEITAGTETTLTPTNRHPHSELPRAELVKTASFHTDVSDTHFYHTCIEFQGHKLPIKLPLHTFPEEVGDYSLISLCKRFSSPNLVTGPVHPHLHTTGAQTHPIILLFNALVTGKRILFLGHKRPAGEVSQFVLAACALGSGCGVVMRGFIERAFPYATLENKDEWEAVPAYIAGVTNPIFESWRMWDVLFDIGTSQVTVSKTIFAEYPPTPLPPIGGASLVSRIGPTAKPEGTIGTENETTKPPPTNGIRTDFATKLDANVDSLFIEDIATAIEYRYSENHVRMKFTEYAMRFVRLASRYEEEIAGNTTIGYPSSPYHEGVLGRPARLGGGMVFRDEAAFTKEIVANANRIEAWRKTDVYRYYADDFQKLRAVGGVHGFDVLHQLARLRQAPTMSDTEVALIMHTLTDNVRTYDQVVEFLACLIPGTGGLLPVAFGLFHQKELIREMTVDFFNQLRAYPIGVIFLQGLNCFQRYAYVRQAHALEQRLLAEQSRLSWHQNRQSPRRPSKSSSQTSRTSLPPSMSPKIGRAASKRSVSSARTRPGAYTVVA